MNATLSPSALAWFGVTAVIIGAIVRVLKSDTPLATVPARFRPWLALGLGVVSGVLQAIASGTPWMQALTSGIGAAATAIVGHDVLVESVRGGREPFGPTDKGSQSGFARIGVMIALALGAITLCAAPFFLSGCALLGPVNTGLNDAQKLCIVVNAVYPSETIKDICRIEGDVADVVAVIDSVAAPQRAQLAKMRVAGHDEGVAEARKAGVCR